MPNLTEMDIISLFLSPIIKVNGVKYTYQIELGSWFRLAPLDNEILDKEDLDEWVRET